MEETKSSHAGNKSRKLNPRPKKAIFTRRPKRENSLQDESKKIDLIQDEDYMKNEYVLPFELKEEEGKNEVHLEGEYYEEETIEFFKEDHFEEPVKLFENYHDEYPDDTIEFVEEPTQQDVIEDISINVSKDYIKGLKVIKDAVKTSYFKSEKPTDILEQGTEFRLKGFTIDSNEMLDQELHQNDCSPLQSTDLEGKDSSIDRYPLNRNKKEKLLTQRELIEELMLQFENKKVTPEMDYQNEVNKQEGKILEDCCPSSRNEKRSLVSHPDLMVNVLTPVEKKIENKKRSTKIGNDFENKKKNQMDQNRNEEKEEPAEEANGGLSIYLSRTKTSDKVRNMSRKMTTTTRNKAQKKILYRKVHHLKPTKIKNPIVKTNKEKREIGGLLFCLEKGTKEKSSNVVREPLILTTNKAHKRIFHNAGRFIKQKQIKNLMTKNKEKNLTLNAKGYCGFNFARCNDTSESVGGAVIYLCGAAVDRKSKRQSTVLLSSTEADSEMAADITA